MRSKIIDQQQAHLKTQEMQSSSLLLPTPPSSTTPESFPERLEQAKQLHRALLEDADEKIHLALEASQLVIDKCYSLKIG